MLYKFEKECGFTEEYLYRSIATEITVENLLQNHTVASNSIPKIKGKSFFPNKNKFNQRDLFFFESILASTGMNRNDDVFTIEDTWNARLTAAHKPINYMHDNLDIVGHMIDTVAVDFDGNILTEMPSKDFDIVVGGVIYLSWELPEQEERVQHIVAEIKSGVYKVSMECFFKNFDYALYNSKGELQHIIKRNEETSFLTRFLRWYGGKGEWEGYKVGRVLRDYFFSAKGLVKKQGNERSLVTNLEVSVANIQETQKETNMSDVKDTNFEVAIASLEKTHELSLNKVFAEFKAEKEKLESTINDLTSKLTASAGELAQVKAESEQKLQATASDLESVTAEKTAFEKAIAEAAEKQKELEATIASLNSELSQIKVEKVVAERIGKLVAAKVSEEKAKEMVQSFASLNDEQFDNIVALTTPTEVTVTKASELSFSESVAELAGRYTAPVQTDRQSDISELGNSIAQTWKK